MGRNSGLERPTPLEVSPSYWLVLDEISDFLVANSEYEDCFFMGILVDGRRTSWTDQEGIYRGLTVFEGSDEFGNFPKFQFVRVKMPIEEEGSLGHKYFYFPKAQNIWFVETFIPHGELTAEETEAIHQSEYEKMANGWANATEEQCANLLTELWTGLTT